MIITDSVIIHSLEKIQEVICDDRLITQNADAIQKTTVSNIDDISFLRLT